MRIGELLLERNWIDWESLTLAIMDQRSTGMRLCSLLVARRRLEFDFAARALGEQRGVHAALRRHLEGRDRSLAALLPEREARRAVALPIGRLGNGTLIVCARDPTPRLRDQLARVIGEPIMLAVALARPLERLVEYVYTEIDVPIDVAADDPELEPVIDDEIAAGPDLSFDVDLSDLATRSRALPVQIKPTQPAPRDPLDAAIASFRDIDDVEWLLDVVTAYLASRWKASLLLAIDGIRATGVRGHGERLKPSVTRSFVLPLSEPSIVQLARDERRIIDETPDDAAKRLAVTLDYARQPVGAPILKGNDVSHVLVVGDPRSGDHDDALRDLEVLAEALGEALAKL